MTDLEQLVVQAAEADLPRIIGELEAARARAWARLTTPAAAPVAAAPRTAPTCRDVL